jgi:endo-1,4-beta-xylanase
MSTTVLRQFAVLIALCAAAPLACSGLLGAGHARFVGSAWSPAQAEGFADYWNKVTPENAGKWGVVEAQRDVMDWTRLDAAYAFARSHGMPFQFHVLVWGNQQPEWIRSLPVDAQRDEIVEWFAAVAQRYPDVDFVEVVNEPLHDPPCTRADDGGGYCEALGGAGATGWDWVVESFQLARRYFPRAQLLINDYSITNTPADARRYRDIVDLLKARDLVDGIGVQGHAFATTCETPVAVHRASLDLLAGAGLPIYVTELDIDGPTDAAQLADMQRVFPMFWEHPAVAGITFWGWRPGLWRHAEGARLVEADGRERPALRWLRAYLQGEALAEAPPCPAPAASSDSTSSDAATPAPDAHAPAHAG